MKPLRIAHRGASGYEPENTLFAIEKAISLGADAVEIDVQRSRDGHLVVIHDAGVERTTDGFGRVSNLELATLRRLRVMPGDLRIPTLCEVLEVVDRRAALMIELKAPGLASAIFETIRSADFKSRVFYASFIHDELLRIRDLDSRAETIALFECIPVDRTGFLRASLATHAGPALSCLSAAFASAIQEQGFKVFTYTANTLQEIAFARDCGVDGIISNYPDRI